MSRKWIVRSGADSEEYFERPDGTVRAFGFCGGRRRFYGRTYSNEGELLDRISRAAVRCPGVTFEQTS